MPHRSRLDDMYGLQQGYGNNGSDGMMEKGHNRKASESLRRPISFFKVPHAAIVDNMRTALQI